MERIHSPTSCKLLLLILAFIFSSFGCAEFKQVIRPAPEYPIKLSARSITPKPGIEKELSQTLEITKKPKVHSIVQFKQALSPEDHKFLNESGLLIQGYLGGNSYIVSIPKEAQLDKGKLKKLIRWAGMFHPRDKLTPALAKREFYDWAVDKRSGKIKLLIQFFRDVDKQAVEVDLASLGIKGTRYGANNSWAVLVDESKIEEIARLGYVKRIEQGPIPFLPLLDGSRRIANTDEAQQAMYNNLQPAYNKVSGDGTQIGICDSGVDENHDDFDQITAAGAPGVSRVYNQRFGSGYHGTHVASIAGGNGFNSAANGLPAFRLSGHAPEAEVGDYPSFGDNAQRYHDAIVNDGTDVTNHSYVQSHTVYNGSAESLDMIVRGDATDNTGNSILARPQVWAAGNNGTCAQYGNEEGYYAVFTSSKNTISVGSVDTIDMRLSEFSSLGPTFDGRIKPDVVAPGCYDSVLELGCYAPGPPDDIGIQAADNNTQGYMGLCGTSMAAPVVSGIIALMMNQFQDTFGNLPRLPSTYKAMLVHTAKDLVKARRYATREFNNPDTNNPVLYHAGPDFATGYGLVDADAARDIVTRSAQWREATINSTGDMDIWCISVPEGAKTLKVVIAWDDEPGDTSTAEDVSKLVNDLDLQLIDPSGNVYLPWTLDPLPLTANPGGGGLDPIQPGDVDPAYTGADHRNNVEMVDICFPSAGVWRAVVRGHNLPNGNAQPYSLVSSHRIVRWCWLPKNICDYFPRLCEPYEPYDICRRYPWLCLERIVVEPPIRVVDERWIIDPREPVPVDEICKYVVDCPGCDGPGWAYCPGWKMVIDKVPADAIVTLINQHGKVLMIDETKLSSRNLVLKRQIPGEQYYLLFTDSKGNPYHDELELSLKLGPLTER